MGRVHMNTENHTSKESAGLQNFNSKMLEEYKDEESGMLLAMIAPIFKKSIGSETQNRKPNWNAEDLRYELGQYFQYFAENGLKPSKSSIRLWLNVSPSGYRRWEMEPERFGEIHEVIMLANDVLETQYINRGEKHPALNTFLLKTSHGHRDVQNLEVTAVNKLEKRDIDTAIDKLKLEEETMEIEGVVEKSIE